MLRTPSSPGWGPPARQSGRSRARARAPTASRPWRWGQTGRRTWRGRWGGSTSLSRERWLGPTTERTGLSTRLFPCLWAASPTTGRRTCSLQRSASRARSSGGTSQAASSTTPPPPWRGCHPPPRLRAWRRRRARWWSSATSRGTTSASPPSKTCRRGAGSRPAPTPLWPSSPRGVAGLSPRGVACGRSLWGSPARRARARWLLTPRKTSM
mmetsp:Transcript_31726/g.101121  ORF Transcript_31726/g.101121 Transcript_31726/m.101121 type:complete len:211 (-) Transcript_31726:365-997(-)